MKIRVEHPTPEHSNCQKKEAESSNTKIIITFPCNVNEINGAIVNIVPHTVFNEAKGILCRGLDN